MNVLSLRLGGKAPKATLPQLIQDTLARVVGHASMRPSVRLGLEVLGPEGRRCWTLDFANGVVADGPRHPVDALVRAEQASMLQFLLGELSLQALQDDDLVTIEGSAQALRQMSAVFS